MSGVMGVFREALEVLFPRRAVCMGCGRMAGCTQDWLCADCAEKLDALFVGDRASAGEGCVFRRAHARMYRRPVSGLVRNFKYHSIGALAEFLAQDMAGAYDALNVEGEVLLTPVPMHWRRKFERGRNHAELLARALSRKLNVPWADALKKTRNTRQQAQLSHAERRRNLLESYRPRRDVSGRAVVLVDDVYTTGATASACAEALLLAGAAHVYVLTYALAVSGCVNPSNPWAEDVFDPSEKNPE